MGLYKRIGMPHEVEKVQGWIDRLGNWWISELAPHVFLSKTRVGGELVIGFDARCRLRDTKTLNSL